jgi:cystathionine beta-lyase/cystathionine gamma-synthase
VRWPGLPDDPGHERARRFYRHFGAMITFDVRTDAAADALLGRLRLALHAASLGGVETLVVRPSRSSHLGLSPGERELLGITDRMIRLSVGIEDAEDLVEDFGQALG